MELENFIIHAYDLDGKGQGKALTNDNLAEMVKGETLTWLHLDADNPKTETWLQNELSYLDPFIVDALLAEETRPRITKISDGELLILRGVNLNQNSTPEDMVSIRVWVDEHRIVSLQKRNLKTISDIVKNITTNNAPKNSGEFVSMLIDLLFDRMAPVLGDMDDQIDIVEEKVLETTDDKLRQDIINLQKQAIILRRYISPQKDVIAQLSTTSQTWINDQNKRSLHESHDKVTRYIESLDAIRERSQVVKDELSHKLTDKLNNNMYKLSIIASIFLPLSFLTGLLGINIKGIPGAEMDHAFWLFCLILVVVFIVQWWIFRKLKWL